MDSVCPVFGQDKYSRDVKQFEPLSLRDDGDSCRMQDIGRMHIPNGAGHRISRGGYRRSCSVVPGYELVFFFIFRGRLPRGCLFVSREERRNLFTIPQGGCLIE